MALKVIDAHMPAQFKEFYPSTRTIIDCTEIFTEVPSSMSVQSLTYSSYKHHNTFKGLIGICPTGAVTFISQLYAGSISDQALTHDCRILELIEPGDSIMADKGFDIAYDVLSCNISRTTQRTNTGQVSACSQEHVDSSDVNIVETSTCLKTIQ